METMSALGKTGRRSLSPERSDCAAEAVPGVGLAPVQCFVQREGGRVRAEAADGQGTAFYFTIPNPKP